MVKVYGAISRVPKIGSFLSNLSKGATAKSTKLSKKLKFQKLLQKT